MNAKAAKKGRVFAKRTARPKPTEEIEAKAQERAKTHGEPVYEVAPDVYLTSRVGELAPGTPVKPGYFSGGAKAIVLYVSKGFLVKREK